MRKQTRCAICGGRLDERFSNNGEPLVYGKVCTDCNRKVVAARMILAMNEKGKETK